RGNPGRVVMLDFAERMADAAHSFLQAVNRRLGIGGGALKLRELAVDGIQIRHGARLGGARERLEPLAVLAAEMEGFRDAVTGPLNELGEGADPALHSDETALVGRARRIIERPEMVRRHRKGQARLAVEEKLEARGRAEIENGLRRLALSQKDDGEGAEIDQRMAVFLGDADIGPGDA